MHCIVMPNYYTTWVHTVGMIERKTVMECEAQVVVVEQYQFDFNGIVCKYLSRYMCRLK